MAWQVCAQFCWRSTSDLAGVFRSPSRVGPCFTTHRKKGLATMHLAGMFTIHSNHRGHDQQLPGVVLASLCGACSSNSTSYACSNLVSSRGLWLFTGEMFAGVRRGLYVAAPKRRVW